MDEVLVATPLPYSSSSQPCDFGGGISIQAISPIRWDLSCLKIYISEDDRRKLDETRYWLCASREARNNLAQVQDLYEAARQAMYALQTIHPSGCDNIYLALHRKPNGFDHIGSCRPTNMKSTMIGRITSAERRGLANDFDTVYRGVARAFSERIVRLQNPLLLLEQGMQTGNPVLAMLMFVMGLDMLFMAGEKVPFVKRVGGFLGLDSYVFPPVLSLDLQPAIRVRDVISDLYDFRNTIAHGQEIPKTPYREERPLVSTTAEAINYEKLSYADILTESGLFILTKALGKIFRDGLYDEVASADKWRPRMTLCEHRFKNTGGIVTSAAKSR